MNVEQTKGLREIPVKIKRLHPDAVIPKYASDLAAGFDLVAVDDVIIAPGETKLIPLGFALEIPEGFELQVRPRSGVTWKTKLRVGNSPGTVDADFRAEVKVIVDNIEPPIYEKSGELAMTDVVVSMCGRNDDVTFAKTHCFPSGTHYIPKGTRIAQGVIAPVYRADFIEVDELGETERGDGGFGSTGVKSEVGA
ncbi:deoxyuridine 5'-triphosphate nucleotidohydrolase [Paenibacillus alvei]|uniref:dUTP diphosphatase n=1 Tax=Paenibacillus alvei TaxID=44250 RepID=A0ABT4EH54_PAEAL|nr:deoxyuridine 5'-triphosphate nucleotidohydrolase [Paenibacillus alvei]MCY9532945.1 deoxyuridine 5'-triphosphate nucleotidohydrolase [Paenibacillus alvei]